MKVTSILLPSLVGLAAVVSAVRPRTTPLKLLARQVPDECDSFCGPVLDPTCDDACACAQFDNIEACLECGIQTGAATEESAQEAIDEIRGICAALGTSLTSATGTSRSGSATNTLSDTASRTTITSVPTATSPSRTTISPSTGTTSNAQATGGGGDELNPTDSPNSAVGNLVGGGLLNVIVGVGVVFGVIGL